jgi:hypothetical protein
MRAQGIFVPVLPAVAQMAGNAKLLATVLSDAPTLSFQRVFPHIDTHALDTIQIVEDLLEDWRPDEEAIVLSAENFRPNHAARLRALFSTVAVTVVLFVRAQDRWMESYHNQLIKSADVRQDLPSFIEATLSQQSDRLCYPDWWQHYTIWQENFGDCRIVFFDEVRSSLFDSFFTTAGLVPPIGIPDIPRQQESIGFHQLTYLSMWDHEVSFPDFVRRRTACAEAARQLGDLEPRILRQVDRHRLVDCFSGSNARLLAALGRPTDDPALQFSTQANDCLTFKEVRDSDPYRRYQALADEIYAGLV